MNLEELIIESFRWIRKRYGLEEWVSLIHQPLHYSHKENYFIPPTPTLYIPPSELGKHDILLPAIRPIFHISVDKRIIERDYLARKELIQGALAHEFGHLIQAMDGELLFSYQSNLNADLIAVEYGFGKQILKILKWDKERGFLLPLDREKL
jgi:hypothetical protein